MTVYKSADGKDIVALDLPAGLAIVIVLVLSALFLKVSCRRRSKTGNIIHHEIDDTFTTGSDHGQSATIEGPSQRIRRYLKEGLSMRFANIGGLSFLRYSIAKLDEKMAIQIIEHGVDVDVNEPWDKGQTPLHWACKMDLIELIQTMFRFKSHEVDLYAVTDDLIEQYNDFQPGGKTALHYAAMNGGGVFLSVCKLLVDFERTVLGRDELSSMVDLEGNDAIADALIYGHDHVARYLMNDCAQGAESVDEWITRRTAELSTKRADDSKSTRKRYERINAESIDEAARDMNRVFVVSKLWNEQQCASMLASVSRFGDQNGWSSLRHRSYSTMDIPTHSVGAELDENVRKILSEELYPQIIDKYRLNERFEVNVDEGERVEIGARDLFFVKYDSQKQRELKLHRDGVLVSFNILLNVHSEFEGGGTYFQHLDEVMSIERGDCVMHSGRVLHAGHPITSGERYILVGFLDAKVRRQPAASLLSDRA